MTTISFIGKKQNSHPLPWVRNKYIGGIERERVAELTGLKSSALQLSKLNNADIVMTRLNPERVNQRQLKRVLRAEKRCNEHTLLLNSASNFENYAEKSRCFEIWREHGLNTPDFSIYNIDTSTSKLVDSVKTHLTDTELLYIRTSNEDSGKGIFTLSAHANDSDIKNCIKQLKNRARFNKVSQSKLMLVKSADNKDEDGISHVFRAHVCCDRIIGGYALVGNQPVIHAKDQNLSHWQSYLKYNQQLLDILQNPTHRNTILLAVRALGADIGAVEFFLINNQLMFLELNPMWGGKHRLGDAQFSAQLQQNLNRLELRNVITWLKPEAFYTKMYNQIHDYYQQTRAKK